MAQVFILELIVRLPFDWCEPPSRSKSVLKNKLSEYVRLVASGETVLVTDRDRVVAELIPPREGRSPILADALLADTVRKGLLSPPTLVTAEPPPALPVAPLADILHELEQDRHSR